MLAYRPLSGKLQPAELCMPSFRELPQGSARLALRGWNLGAADCKRMAACVKPDKSVILGTAAAQELLDWDVAHGDKTLKQ